ncbi:TonB family protein [Telmatobacter bradus]|uniref:TonB family protein n=1 Tax=Telmatobacter bradus TaxID=474953 RepID=UPI003B43CEEB
MNENGAKLEQELLPEPIAVSAAGSLTLHGVLLATVLCWGWAMGLFHHNQWGSKGMGSNMQVSLTAALPLPNDQPANKNVLTTDTPSPAPAPPQPKTKEVEDDKATPIATKVKQQPKPQAKQQAQPQPKQQQQPKQQAQSTAQKASKNQPKPVRDNQAHYGEQSGSVIPRGVQQHGNNGPAQVGDSDFQSMFGYYVAGINSKMSQAWNRYEVDPRTPHGTRVFILFTIHRDGSPSNVQLDRSSGSPTLDRSCMRGVQRIDTFGSLPPAYNQSTLKVSYYCEY